MSGLEVIGVSGSEDVKELLITCSNPDEAIEKFQRENSILLPSIQPALSLLDLQGVQRLTFHESVVEMLRDALLKQISTGVIQLPEKQKQKKLSELLAKSFPLVRVPDLRGVTMEILKHIPSIKEVFLKEIEDDQELYEAAPVEAKRQIWKRNHSLFGKQLFPLVTEYIASKQKALSSYCSVTPSSTAGSVPAIQFSFFSVPPRIRRQSPDIQAVTSMVGGSLILYRLTLQMLTRLFLRTRDAFYCSLRGDLLMALHENEVNEICLCDPVHKVTWCIDACTREGKVDAKRAAELVNFMDGIKKEQLRGEDGVELLSALAMVLSDPYAIHTFGQVAAQLIDTCVSSETLPRDSPDLLLMVRLLTVGIHSLVIIESKSPKEVDMDSQLVTVFLAELVNCVTESKAINGPALIELFSSEEITSSPTAILIAIHYACHSAREGGCPVLCALISSLPHWSLPEQYQGQCLHHLTTMIIERSRDLALMQLLFPAIQHLYLDRLDDEWPIGHLLRFLSQSPLSLSDDQLLEVTTALTSAAKSEDLITACSTVIDKIPKRDSLALTPHTPDSIGVPIGGPSSVPMSISDY